MCDYLSCKLNQPLCPQNIILLERMTDRQIITIQTWVFEKTNTWILANEQRLFLQGKYLTVFAAADEIQASKNIRIWENLHLYCISHGVDKETETTQQGKVKYKELETIYKNQRQY